MSKISDIFEGGYWPLQHHETAAPHGVNWDKESRLLRFACRVFHVDGQRRAIKQGPVLGGHVWETKDPIEFPNIWTFGTASVVKGSENTQMVKGPSWDHKELSVKELKVVFPNDQEYPDGWSCLSLPGINFDFQYDLALPGFDGLVAPHFENKPKLGTPVYELDGRGLGVNARLQHLCRVYEPPLNAKCLSWGPDQHLALQLGSSNDGAGFLVFADDPDKITTGGKQDLATGQKRGGGPFDVGGGACPHFHGINSKGETMRALHLRTGSLFRGGIGDGPINFGKEYDPFVVDAPFLVKTHLRWNSEKLHTWGCGTARGVWDLQTESFISPIVPPPPLDPPREGDGFVAPVPLDPLEPLEDPLADPDAEPFPRELFIPPELFGGDRIGDFREKPKPLYGSSIEIAFPAIVGRAQHFSAGNHDLRSVGKRLSNEQQENWACLPATMRTEYYGAQEAETFSETQSKHRGRYQNVPTSNGGRVNMPPELGLEYLVSGFDDLEGLTYSTTYDVYWNSRLAFGTPIITGTNAGGVASGCYWEKSQAGEGLCLYETSAAGAATKAGCFAPGGILNMEGDVQIGNTSLALYETASVSANFISDDHIPVGPEVIIFVDTSGGAVDFELNTDADWIGRKMTIKDTTDSFSSNPVRIDSGLIELDGIVGGYNLDIDGMSATITYDGSAWFTI